MSDEEVRRENEHGESSEVVPATELSRALQELLERVEAEAITLRLDREGVQRWVLAPFEEDAVEPGIARIDATELSKRATTLLAEVDATSQPIVVERKGRAVAVLRPSAHVTAGAPPALQTHETPPAVPTSDTSEEPGDDKGRLHGMELGILLLAIAAAVFAALPLPAVRIGLGVAIVVLAWRRLVRAPLRDAIQAFAVVAAVVFLVLTIVTNGDDEAGNKAEEPPASTRPADQPTGNVSAPSPRNEASPGKVLQVDNRVTSGMKMAEDPSPTSLTTKAIAYCGKRGCNIPNTERQTGGSYDAAVCQRRGEEISNGNDGSPTDDKNPLLDSSDRYYGVRLEATDTFGYVNEVWIARRQRGGLGLPPC
jgi:hypothetical protein